MVEESTKVEFSINLSETGQITLFYATNVILI